jgi:methyltransferase (TIGR00027 family)
MQPPISGTARSAALLRAAHQLLDGGSIFADPFAVPIAAESAETIRSMGARPELRALRLFIAARSRLAEDCLAQAVERGVRQAVVLGAGLDTLGLRNPHAVRGLRIYEADRPATQQGKQECLRKSKLPIPDGLSFVAVDFEQQSWIDALVAAGFHANQPAFFTWLGVVPYLSRAAVLATLSSIAAVPDAEVVFDYGEPPETYVAEMRAGYEAMIARAAAGGEPWQSFFDPGELGVELLRLGFRAVEDLSPFDVSLRFGLERSRDAPGAHFVRARCTSGDQETMRPVQAPREEEHMPKMTDSRRKKIQARQRQLRASQRREKKAAKRAERAVKGAVAT